MNPSVSSPTSDELELLLKNLSLTGTNPVVLAVSMPYADACIPKTVNKDLPKILTSLVDEKCIQMNYSELLQHCTSIDITVSEEQCNQVESLTKDQSNCKAWYQYRAGRITASHMRAVCKTNVKNPSMSLLKAICYPELNKVTTYATRWGCEHEKVALEKFQSIYG